MKRIYGILLILVGLIFLLFLRDELVQGMRVFTGDVDYLLENSTPAPNPSLNTLSYIVPIVAIVIGILTLVRAHFQKTHKSPENPTPPTP